MNCECIKLVNEKLKAIGQELNLLFELSDSGKMAAATQVGVTRIDGSRKKLTLLASTFCPFCGVKCDKEVEPTLSVPEDPVEKVAQLCRDFLQKLKGQEGKAFFIGGLIQGAIQFSQITKEQGGMVLDKMATEYPNAP
jgi:hypothetical protein